MGSRASCTSSASNRRASPARCRSPRRSRPRSATERVAPEFPTLPGVLSSPRWHDVAANIHIAFKGEGTMQIIRREFLTLSGLAVAAPSVATIALAQAQAGPKLTQILRKDLEGQGEVVQETVVSIVEFPPGAAAPWHMHPGAQELLHVIEGNLTVEIE